MGIKNDLEKFRNRAPRDYTVKQGDSWFSVAGKLYGDFYGGNVEGQRMAGELARANGNIQTLRPGMVLRIPQPRQSPYIGANQFEGVTGNATTPQVQSPVVQAPTNVPIGVQQAAPPPNPQNSTFAVPGVQQQVQVPSWATPDYLQRARMRNNLPVPTPPSQTVGGIVSQVGAMTFTSAGGTMPTYNANAAGGGGGGAPTGPGGGLIGYTPTTPTPTPAPNYGGGGMTAGTQYGGAPPKPKTKEANNGVYPTYPWLQQNTHPERMRAAEELAAGLSPYVIPRQDVLDFNLNPDLLAAAGYQLTSYGYWVRKNVGKKKGGGQASYGGGYGYGGGRGYGGGGGGYEPYTPQPSVRYLEYQTAHNPTYTQTGRAYTPMSMGLINWRGI